MKAVVAALKKFPAFNSSLDGENLILKQYWHIGFAADTPNGLVVPVIRDADQKGIVDIARETAELAAKARDGKLGPPKCRAARSPSRRLGGIGGTAFTPIINAPEVAILGVSKAAMKPVWNGKEFAPRLMMPLSLSYDHRVIDGALGRALHHLPRPGASPTCAAACSRSRHGRDRDQGPRHRRLQGRPGDRDAGEAGRQRRQGRIAGHARKRQGDDGSALAARRRREGAAREDGRQGLPGHA